MARKSIAVDIKWKDRRHRAWFPLSFTVYKLSDERLYIQTGLFNTHYDETLLYRIVDICLQRSLPQKLFGTGTIILYTKSDTQGTIRLENIKHPMAVKEMLSDIIEKARTQRGVVGREFYTSDRGPHGADGAPDMQSGDPDAGDTPEGFSFRDDH